MESKLIDRLLSFTLALAILLWFLVATFYNYWYGLSVLIGACWAIFNLYGMKWFLYSLFRKKFLLMQLMLVVKFPFTYFLGYYLLKQKMLPPSGLLIGFSLLFLATLSLVKPKLA